MQRVGGLMYLTTQFRRRRAILNDILPFSPHSPPLLYSVRWPPYTTVLYTTSESWHSYLDEVDYIWHDIRIQEAHPALLPGGEAFHFA